MDIWKSLDGMVEAELTSAEPGAALEAANARGIPLYDVIQVGDLTARFRVRRRDCRTLEALSEKRGETLRLRRRLGAYWTLKRLLARPMLLCGLAVFLAAAIFLPTRIFFVRVEGNMTTPTRLILDAAGESGIRLGFRPRKSPRSRDGRARRSRRTHLPSPRVFSADPTSAFSYPIASEIVQLTPSRSVRSEKMKNALLSALPQLQWAGVNTSGCVATVSVRERTDPEVTEQDSAVSSIVASRDGFIVSATVTRGNFLCRVGQSVKAGQVLVSGYTDCGICIQATRAEGEIYAQTSRDFAAVTPAQWTVRGEQTAVRRKYSLIIGKKRINLWKDSGILQGSCDRMDRRYELTLPGGFRLPVTLCVEEYTFYDGEMMTLEPDAAEAALSKFAQSALTQQMVAGRILSREESITQSEDKYLLEGTYACVEMIGRVRREQIGDTNGKSG